MIKLGLRQTLVLFVLCVMLVPRLYAEQTADGSGIDLSLSTAERQWLQQNREIYFTGDPNWLPYEAFQPDGQYIGIVADHLKLIERYAGIKFKPIPVSTWSESLQIATEGKVDVISGDAADAILNRQFKPVDAYSHNPIVIIMDVNQNYVEDLEQIRDKRIAIIKDYGYTADIFTTYPDFKFIEVENIQQGLNGVSEKRYDAMLATVALASYHMAEMGLRNIKVVGKTPIIMDLTLFVDQQQPILHSIINKTLNALPHAATQGILQNWVTRDYVEKTDYRLVLQIVLAITLLFALSMWWIMRLRREIRSRQQAEDSLRASEQRYDMAMAVANDGIWDWEIDSNRVLFDKRYYQMAGYEPNEFPHAFEEWEKRVHARDIQAAKAALERFLKNETQDFDVEFRFQHKLGHYMWIQARAKVVRRDEKGHPQRVVGTHSDITQKKAYQKQLEHIAHFDALTHLPNRVLLTDRLNQAMLQARRRDLKLAVVYLDLDGFKAINDDNGHQVGDQFLTNLASRMQNTLRKGDTLARLGGDEFVAVLIDLPKHEESLPLVNRLLDAAAMPLRVNKTKLQVSASIGVTYYPQDNDVDAEQLLRQADQAMYQAKMQGKNRYHVFDFELDSNLRGQLENLEDISRGFKNQQFILHYQPKVNMHSGEVVGLEALIRWLHPQQGLLTPVHFLPFIENTGLEIEIGEWVIDSVVRQLSLWAAEGLVIPVSINIGAMHLQRDDFVDKLTCSLSKYPEVNSGLIELEVLETSALEDVQRVSDIISRCNDIGVKFALDDFGTGYSSLTYLKQLPAATLKIDQSFVRDMLEDPEDLAILEGVIGIASAFNRQVIAEGVETIEQGNFLIKLGCRMAQGFQISRPMRAEKVIPWIQSWQPHQSWLLQQPYDREDFSILFAAVEHRLWVKNVELSLDGENTGPLHLDHQECSFGKWLNSEGKKKYGDSELFDSIQRLHLQIHEYANELITLNGQRQNDQPKAGVDRLIHMRDHMLDELNALIM